MLRSSFRLVRAALAQKPAPAAGRHVVERAGIHLSRVKREAAAAPSAVDTNAKTGTATGLSVVNAAVKSDLAAMTSVTSVVDTNSSLKTMPRPATMEWVYVPFNLVANYSVTIST